MDGLETNISPASIELPPSYTEVTNSLTDSFPLPNGSSSLLSLQPTPPNQSEISPRAIQTSTPTPPTPTPTTPSSAPPTPTSPLAPLMHKVQPKVFEKPPDEFTITDRLGKGSFGAVYKAIHKPTGQVVALKKCITDTLQESLGEIEIMRECNHPSIIKYYGNHMFEGFLWIAMEYAALGALTDVMKLCGRTTLKISTVDVNNMLTLSYIKPENVLITGEGEPKLADFGVAGKYSFEDKRTTLTGTPYYIAPEILQENNPGYDTKADIWSLGICAIEFAQGEPPWFNASPMRVMFLIAANAAPTFNEPTKYSKEFNEFVRACLIKAPARRAAASDLLTCDFINNAKPCPVALAGLVQQATKVIESYGGLEDALKITSEKRKNTGFPSDILGESRIPAPITPDKKPGNAFVPAYPNTQSPADKKEARKSGGGVFASGAASPTKIGEPVSRKEKEARKKEDKKKEKEAKKAAKDEKKADQKNEPGLRNMLNKFFGGGRPSQEDLMKKKILSTLYEGEFP